MAYFIPGGKRIRLWEDRVCGTLLLRCEIPEYLTVRKKRHLYSILRRAGVRAVLFPVPGTEDLPFPILSTRRLWQLAAGRCVTEVLRQVKLPPEQATVELWAAWPSPQVYRAAEELLPRVRALSLSLPEGDALGWSLQRRFGIPPRRGQGDLTVRFSPGPERRLALDLWPEHPHPPGLTPDVPGAKIPSHLPRLPMLALLEERGLISAKQLVVRGDFP